MEQTAVENPQEGIDLDTLAHVPDLFQFVDQVNQFLQLSGWTAERMARACGVSRTTFSLFINNKYSGDVDGVRAKIASVIESENERLSRSKFNPNFIETSVSKRFFDIARMCHVFCEIGVCFADAGIGKTEAAREYSSQKPEVILIEADPGYSPSVLFNELHDRLGNGGRHNLHQTFVDCVDRLKGSKRMLIVDEAEQLPYKCLELVRRLHDKAGIGILMTGMPRLISNLRGYRGQFAQLYSRVQVATKLDPLTEDDTENIVRRLTGDSNKLWQVYHKESRGNTRRLFKMIRLAIHISDVNNCQIDTEVVREAVDHMAIERMF